MSKPVVAIADSSDRDRRCPPLPPQRISKYSPSLKLKTFIQPLRKLFNRACESGWFGGSPLKRHVVVCGFPRSGSTLLQLMIESCVADIRTYGRERRGTEAAACYRRTHPTMMTKRPSDIFTISDLRTFYSSRGADVRFVLMVRDPRDVLTSIHHSRPDDFYVSAERWRAIWEYWQWAAPADDVCTVRYEDLVSNPGRLEAALTSFLGWNVVRPFSEFHQAVPDNFDVRALNGVRKADRESISRWRHARYDEKLRALLRFELPELPQRLIELGYERDKTWTRRYSERSDYVARAA